MAVLARKELEESPLADLHAIASELGIEGYRKLRKADLIDTILAGGNGDGDDAAEAEAPPEAEERPRRRRGGRGRGRSSRAVDADEGDADAEEAAEPAPPEPEPEEEQRTGILDILPNGSGFMRADAFVQSRDDVYVSPAQIRRCELRAGDQVGGPVRPPRRNERHPSLVRVEKVNDADAEPPAERPLFDALTPVYATEKLSAPDGLEAAPFGKGSRVAVGGSPGSGATTTLRRIALTLQASHPDLELIVVLAGVRPEEVTEWRRDSSDVTIAGGGFDGSPDDQAQAAEMAIERGKRAAESGRDAVVIVDSLDALSPSAARRVFGAARNAEGAGSLTVIAATGLAGEPQRQATTRIVLELGEAGAAPTLGPSSGTLRADLLS